MAAQTPIRNVGPQTQIGKNQRKNAGMGEAGAAS